MTTADTQNSSTSEANEAGRLSGAAERVRETASAARARASEAYEAARSRAGDVYSTARESATRVGRGTVQRVDGNPLGALIGGFAVGAVVAAILPRTRKEEELLGDYGRRVQDRAREAAQAARDAGTSKLDEMGISKENIRQKLDGLTSQAKEAIGAGGGKANGGTGGGS